LSSAVISLRPSSPFITLVMTCAFAWVHQLRNVDHWDRLLLWSSFICNRS
jgi:hypothetical protein